MTNQKINITASTDGACKGNPGAGGYGVVLRDTDTRERLGTLRGRDPDTTNNRMELLAAIRTIEWFKAIHPEEQRGVLTIRTDSEYLQKGTEEWMPNWKQNGWRTANKKPVKNQDLWMQLDRILPSCIVKFEWVKGHGGDPDNDEADKIASEEAEKAQCAFPNDDDGDAA